MNKNFQFALKVIMPTLLIVFGIFILDQYDEFVEYELYEDEVIKISDELYGNITREVVYNNRMKLIGICNKELHKDYKVFEDLVGLTVEEWVVLSENNENFNALHFSMINASAIMKDNYFKSVSSKSPWIDDETQNVIIEGYEYYVSMKEAKNKSAIFRFYNYLLS